MREQCNMGQPEDEEERGSSGREGDGGGGGLFGKGGRVYEGEAKSERERAEGGRREIRWALGALLSRMTRRGEGVIA